jgi:hypothetical protein
MNLNKIKNSPSNQKQLLNSYNNVLGKKYLSRIKQ